MTTGAEANVPCAFVLCCCCMATTCSQLTQFSHDPSLELDELIPILRCDSVASFELQSRGRVNSTQLPVCNQLITTSRSMLDERVAPDVWENTGRSTSLGKLGA